MDCDKFEATMLDELYGELDELTLAASKRHVGGCARCSTLMAGLRATRKVVTLPVLLPSEGFESRLLLAVQAAEEEAKPGLSFAQVLSWAGSWAMRPQTAMAAVFLLIVGTSSVLLSRKAPTATRAGAESAFTVTENGVPAAGPAVSPMAMDRERSLDPQMAAAAHGLAPSPAASAAPGPMMAKPVAGLENAPADLSNEQRADTSGKLAYAPKSRPARMAPGGATFDDVPGTLGSIGHGGQGGLGDLKGNPQAQFSAPPPASPVARAAEKDESPLGAAKEQYRNGDYDGATRSFDQIAGGGDASAGLWAARSVRDGAGGCTAAASRFDAVANASFGSATGYDATLEAANCYARIGQIEAARSRYNRLLTVPNYASRAQTGINSVSQVATKRAMAKAVAPAAAAPAGPPPSPAATPAASTAGPPAK